jgi:hypothetical protein
MSANRRWRLGQSSQELSERNMNKNKQGYNKYFCLFFWFTSKALCGDLDKSHKSAESA